MKTNLTKIACLSALLLLVACANAQRHSAYDEMDTSGRAKFKAPVRDITFGFFSPMNQHLTFGYEQLIGEDYIISGHLGIIGPGLNMDGTYNGNYNTPVVPSPYGFFASCGLKMFIKPDFWINGMYRTNKLQGWFFMPEIVGGWFNIYSYNYNYWWGTPSTLQSNGVTNYAMILNFGRQFVLAKAVILNLYAGIGYGGEKVSGPPLPFGEPITSNYYDYIESAPLVFSAGLDMGILLK